MNNIEFYKILKYIKKNYKSLTLNILSFAMVFNLLSSCKVNNTELDDIDEAIVSDEVTDFYKEKGINVLKLDDGTKYISSLKYLNMFVKLAYSNDEFNSFTEESFVTINDVTEAIKNNKCINGVYKEWLDEYVHKIYFNNPSIDFSVFYYNVVNLKEIRFVSSDGISATKGTNGACFFSSGQHILYIANDFAFDMKSYFNFEITRFFTEAVYRNNNDVVVRTNNILIPVYNEEYGFVTFEEYSRSLNVGSIDLFLMENNMLDEASLNMADFSDAFGLFLMYKDHQVLDIYKNGMVEFYNELYNSGISSLSTITEIMDEYLKELSDNHYEYNDGYLTIRKLVYYYYVKNVVSGCLSEGKNLKEISEIIVASFENSYILKQINLGNEIFKDRYDSHREMLEYYVIDAVNHALREKDKEQLGNITYEKLLSMVMGSDLIVTYLIDDNEEYKLVYKLDGWFKYIDAYTFESLDAHSIWGEYVDNLSIECFDENGLFDIERYKNYHKGNTKRLV